jgi:hypothetical protein
MAACTTSVGISRGIQTAMWRLSMESSAQNSSKPSHGGCETLSVEEMNVANSKKPKKVTRPKRDTHDLWFNAFMRLQHRELARLEDENERLRKLTR